MVDCVLGPLFLKVREAHLLLRLKRICFVELIFVFILVQWVIVGSSWAHGIVEEFICTIRLGVHLLIKTYIFLWIFLILLYFNTSIFCLEISLFFFLSLFYALFISLNSSHEVFTLFSEIKAPCFDRLNLRRVFTKVYNVVFELEDVVH